jgi:sensor domain CHASE-containing protein
MRVFGVGALETIIVLFVLFVLLAIGLLITYFILKTAIAKGIEKSGMVAKLEQIHNDLDKTSNSQQETNNSKGFN